MTRPVPPVVPPLPQPIRRSRRGDAAREGFEVELETVTPILGGAAATRAVDEVDVVRVPTIRGHLRFWWRALQWSALTDPMELYQAEMELWGRAANDSGGRSQLEVSAVVTHQSSIDRNDVNPNAPGGYALWPARKGTSDPAAAPRRQPRVRFRLGVSAPVPALAEIRNSVCAWILFGGYGGRTRRGLGALSVAGDHRTRREWLPSVEDPEELSPAELQTEFTDSLARLFGRDIFAGGPSVLPLPLPLTAGAALLVGGHYPQGGALAAWHEALHWLRDFRQQPGFAREPGRPNHPGRSRWPEADKLRHLTARNGHQPRYDDPTPAWPRAEFGLPIVGRFQGPNEPPEFQLTWRNRDRNLDPSQRVQDRMASPLVVKALPTVQGFRPCALWFNRANPPGEIVAIAANKTLIPNSAAPFGSIGTVADAAVSGRLRAPLARATSVRVAFLDWVARKDGVVRIAP